MPPESLFDRVMKTIRSIQSTMDNIEEAGLMAKAKGGKISVHLEGLDEDFKAYATHMLNDACLEISLLQESMNKLYMEELDLVSVSRLTRQYASSNTVAVIDGIKLYVFEDKVLVKSGDINNPFIGQGSNKSPKPSIVVRKG